MFRRFRLLSIVCWLIVILIVSACANEESNQSPNQANNSNVNADKEERPTTVIEEQLAPANLVIYSTSGWTEEAFDERFGAIKQKFPQHTFEYIQSAAGTRYPDLIAANQQIDIIWESVANFRTGPIEYGTAFDLSDLIKKHSIDVSRINTAMVERMRVMSDGGLYALPVLNNTLSLYYNKDLFDKFGVDYVVDGMSWEEIYAVNNKLNRLVDGVQYVGLSFSDGHYFSIHPIGLPVVDANNKPTITNGQWNPLFETFIQTASMSEYKEKIRSQNAIPNLNNFRTHLDAAMFAGLANTHMTQDLSQLNWDVVQFPLYSSQPGLHPQTYPTYFGVANISKNKDQAMEVIKYLVSDEFQIIVSRTGALPVVNSLEVLDVFAADRDFKEKNVRSALYSQFASSAAPTIYDAKLSSIYRKNLRALALGEIDLNTLLRTAEEEAQKAIAEMNSQ